MKDQNTTNHYDLTQRQFIYLLLHNEDLVDRWMESDIGLDYFEDDFKMILTEIKKCGEQGFLLTRKAFLDHVKKLSVPKERIKQQVLLDSCCAVACQRGDYVSLEEKLRQHGKQNILVDGMVQVEKTLKNGQGYDKVADIFRNIASGLSKPPASTETDLGQVLQPYFSFPTNSMPKVLQGVIKEGAQVLSCPPDFVGVSLLTVLAGCIGRSHRIKLNDSWYESTALWTALIGKPSSVKSPILKLITQPVYDQEVLWNCHYEDDLKDHIKAKSVHEKAYLEWKRDKLTHADPPEEPKPPIMKRIIVSNSTVEALVPLMRDNPKGLLLLMDEIGGLFGSMNKYNSGSDDTEFYLQTWSGGTFKVDRKKDGIVVVRDLYLSLCGGIQPDRFLALLGGKNQDNGMAARILPCYPNPVKAKFSLKGIDPSVMARISQLFKDLIHLQSEVKEDWGGENGMPETLVPITLSLTPLGLTAFAEAHERLVNLEYQYPLEKSIEGLYGKLRGYCARIALVLHLIRFYSQETTEKNVDEISVGMAEQLVYYFLAHAHKIWVADSVRSSEEIYRRIKRHASKFKLDIIPIRRLVQSRVAPTTQELKAMINQMVESNLAEWTDSQRQNFRLK
jgi:G:T-mismatch repair DNA endonuclease (very short patch repair protein)